MIRSLMFFLAVGAAAVGAAWFADRPGDIILHWQGYTIETSLGVALAFVLAVALVLMLLWSLLRLLFRAPGMLSFAARGRRQAKGYAALSRGLVAVGAGHKDDARRHARDAARLLGKAPLTLLLQAQAAQLGGDRPQAEAAFAAMLDLPEARALGHRGLHVEARRRGDDSAAYHHAQEAQKISAAPWASDAVFDRSLSQGDWREALSLVDKKQRAKLIDKAAANRQRAVLKTAMALDVEAINSSDALRLAREAVKLAPGLVPAVTLAARLMHPTGEARKAERLIEDAWRIGPHPDLAAAYVGAQPGASNAERLSRARSLARLAPNDAESALATARAAVAARNVNAARAALAPLLEALADSRPTARLCLLMAEVEEAAGAPAGVVREWLARASRAPRDASWVADGVTSERWLPVSPVSGRLDAFEWRLPPGEALRELPVPGPVRESPAALPEAAPAPAVAAPAAALLVPTPAVPVPAPPPDRPPIPDDPGPPAAEEPPRARRGWFS